MVIASAAAERKALVPEGETRKGKKTEKTQTEKEIALKGSSHHS